MSSSWRPRAGVGQAGRALAEAEELVGPVHSLVADALHALGECVHSLGRVDEARTAWQRALDIRTGQDPRHLEAAVLLDALGRAARQAREPTEAIHLHERALVIWSTRLGEHAGPVGACCHALAQAHHRTGDFAGALHHIQRAARITERTLGTDHVDTWITRFELARFRVDCGHWLDGTREMEQARDEVASRLGRHHPVVTAMDRFL